LTILSYRFDKLVLDLDTRWMHVENILLHLSCVFLVYLLTRYLITVSERSVSKLPLITAMLFAVHPLATESTSWISGRTDLLAGVFILLSASLILRFRELQHWWLFPFAVISFLLATFGKEVAIAFMPGALALLSARTVNFEQGSVIRRSSIRIGAIFASLGVVGAFIGYFIVRFGAHNTSGRLGLTFRVILDDLWYSTFVCLRGIGFYFKKIFLPWPLNFAILEVDPLYELLAIPVVLLVLWLLVKRSLIGAFVFTGALLLTPSFLLMFNQIAWTPYAERYLYVPLGFIVPAVIVGGASFFHGRCRVFSKILLVLVFLAFTLTTVERSLIWRRNLTLWQQTVEVSPISGAAKNELGLALHRLGRDEEALKYFKAASELRSGIGYNPRYGINYGLVFMALGKYEEASREFIAVLDKTNGSSKKAKQALKELYAVWEDSVASDKEREELQSKLQGLLERYSVSNSEKPKGEVLL
jgi:hypothetical protein